MWVYLLLLIVVFILLIMLMSLIYIVRITHDIIKKYIKNITLSWIISLLSILIFIPGFFIDMVNAIVVDIHLIAIVFFIKLLFFSYQKITKKKKVSEYIVLVCGILFTTIYLSYGYYLAHNVVTTNYSVETTKDIGENNFRIVQVSDSHIGATFNGEKFIKYMEDINKLNPDIVVLTGDFVDDNTSYKDMVSGTVGLGKLKTKYGVYFIYGNHDKGYFNNRGYNDTDIRKNLKENNVTIIEDDTVNITDNIVLIGRQDASVQDRISAIDLTRNIAKDKYIIMLDHQPNDYKNETLSKSDLVLSGHTHGGQLIPLGKIGVLLGANDKNYGMEKIDDTTFIVNSGIGDWAIKFKTGAIAEYSVIDIKKK